MATQQATFLRHFELLICSWCTEARLGNFAYRPVRARGSTKVWPYLRCRSAKALRGHCVLRWCKGLPPLSPHPFLCLRRVRLLNAPPACRPALSALKGRPHSTPRCWRLPAGAVRVPCRKRYGCAHQSGRRSSYPPWSAARWSPPRRWFSKSSCARCPPQP